MSLPIFQISQALFADPVRTRDHIFLCKSLHPDTGRFEQNLYIGEYFLNLNQIRHEIIDPVF